MQKSLRTTGLVCKRICGLISSEGSDEFVIIVETVLREGVNPLKYNRVWAYAMSWIMTTVISKILEITPTRLLLTCVDWGSWQQNLCKTPAVVSCCSAGVYVTFFVKSLQITFPRYNFIAVYASTLKRQEMLLSD